MARNVTSADCAAVYEEPGVAMPLHEPTTDWDEADRWAAMTRRR